MFTISSPIYTVSSTRAQAGFPVVASVDRITAVGVWDGHGLVSGDLRAACCKLLGQQTGGLSWSMSGAGWGGVWADAMLGKVGQRDLSEVQLPGCPPPSPAGKAILLATHAPPAAQCQPHSPSRQPAQRREQQE